MTREVSRRTSRPPETKAKVSRPDIPGKRDLDPKIVRDVPDPAPKYVGMDLSKRPSCTVYYDETGEITEEQFDGMVARATRYRDNNNGPEIQRGADMDDYLKNLGPPIDEVPVNLRNRKRERKG